MPQEYERKYTISLQGREFTLRRSQIEFDSPNYFTACFLGDFHEAETGRIELNRDPDLFRIIISHLNGYVVLPLNEKTLPGGASLRSTLLNLRADAQFYQLDGLLKACDEELDRRKKQYMVLGFKYRLFDAEVEHMEENGEYWSPLKGWPTQAEWQTYVTEDELSQGPLSELKPSKISNQYSLEQMGAIGRLAANSIKDFDSRRYRLVGWNQVVNNQPEPIVTDYMVYIVYEDRDVSY